MSLSLLIENNFRSSATSLCKHKSRQLMDKQEMDNFLSDFKALMNLRLSSHILLAFGGFKRFPNIIQQ